MFAILFLLMFLVPAATLCWRIVVSKTRTRWLRIGAAAAAMISAVGAFVIYDDIASFSFRDWRNILALVAALSGSAYLMLWALRSRGNRRHRTISLIAAVIGVVPALGAFAAALFYVE